ncbi:MAG: hypothetical protein ACI9R3_005008 [Verrucomicrobiales bacterium]|jgi:hypothetical protein
MRIQSIVDFVSGLFQQASGASHTFYTSDRTSPIKGIVTAVGPRNLVVRTRKGKEVRISLSTLKKKDRNYVDGWLDRHPLPQSVEPLPELKLSVKKRIDPKTSGDPSEPKLRLYFDVTVENLTDTSFEEISIAYTLFNQHTDSTQRWEAVTTGELACALSARECETHCIAGSIHTPEGNYGPHIHRIVVYGLISGRVVAQASDSAELLRHLSLQNANLAI